MPDAPKVLLSAPTAQWLREMARRAGPRDPRHPQTHGRGCGVYSRAAAAPCHATIRPAAPDNARTGTGTAKMRSAGLPIFQSLAERPQRQRLARLHRLDGTKERGALTP